MNKTIKNILYFFCAVLLVKFFGSFRTFFTAKILEPSSYGIWITLLLITSYSPIICLGTVEALVKKIPYYLGKKDHRMVKKIDSCVFGSIIISATFLLLIGLTFNLFIQNQWIDNNLKLIRIMIIVTALGIITAYFHNRLIAYQNFKMVSFIESIQSFTGFVLIVTFAWFWDLTGAVIALLVHQLFICILAGIINKHVLDNFSVSFNLDIIKDLVRIGFPITIIWWIYIVMSSADRIIIMSMLGEASTGYYGLGIALISLVNLLPQSVSRVLYPRVNEKMGQTSNLHDLHDLVIRPAQALSIILPYLIGLLILAAPILYMKLLSKYQPGLLSAQILLIGCFFNCLLRTGANFLIASNKENRLFVYFIVCFFLNITGNISLINLGLGITGVAISTSFSLFTLTTLIFNNVFKSLGFSFYESFMNITKLYSPLILCIIILILLYTSISDLIFKFDISLILIIFIFWSIYSALLCTLPPFKHYVKELFALISNNFSLLFKTGHK